MPNRFSGWDAKRVGQLQQDGKIRSFRQVAPDPATVGGRIVTKVYPSKSKGKNYIAWNMLYWANSRKLQLTEEYRFDPVRKFRFDFCVEELKLAIEFDGGIYDTSGSHTRPSKVRQDSEKLNLAASQGWTVLRYNAATYEQLLRDLEKLNFEK